MMRAELLLVLLCLALAGCGPGSGGTGVPGEGGTAAAGSSGGQAAAPDAGAGAGAAAATPADPPLLDGTIDAADSQQLVVAGTALPRSLVDAVDTQGRPVDAQRLQPGVAVRVWRVSGRYLVVLQ